MSYDLSWLWNTLNNIISSVQSWFSNLWSSIETITNTGQGIFSGLVAFGSQLWDGLIKAFYTFGEWISDAYSWIYDGIKYWADTFGSWFNTAIGWVGSGLNYIGQQFYNFGNWLWNSIMWVGDVVRNTLLGIWTWITNTFAGISTAISSWWSGVINGVNTWFLNILKTFRQKLVTTLTVDVSIINMWKAGERVLHPSSIKDVGYGLFGIVTSPIIGYAIGRFIDSMLPLPSTDPYPLIPDISGITYTPPTPTIERPTTPTAPSMGTPPSIPGIMLGLPYDVKLTIPIRETCDYTTTSTDNNLNIANIQEICDCKIESTDLTITPPNITYEYQVT